MRNDNLENPLVLIFTDMQPSVIPNSLEQTLVLLVCLMLRNVCFLLVQVIFSALFDFYDTVTYFSLKISNQISSS